MRSLHAQDVPETGHAGQRVALNLTSDFSREAIRRGMELDPRQHLPLDRFAATLRLARDETQALRHWTPVHVHLGAEDIIGRVALPIPLHRGPRPWPRSCSNGRSAASPATASCCATPRRRARWPAAGCSTSFRRRGTSAPARLAALRLAAQGEPAAALRELLVMPARPASCSNASRRGWNLTDADAGHLWQGLAPFASTRATGVLGFAADVWAGSMAKTGRRAAAENERAPGRRTRATASTDRHFVAHLDHLVDAALAAGRIAQTSSWLHLPEHRVTLSAADSDLWRSLAPLVAAEPFQPPRVRDIAKATAIPEDTVRALMKRVARTGKLYPVAPRSLSATMPSSAWPRSSRPCSRHGAARAAELRDIIGGGRRWPSISSNSSTASATSRRVRDLRGTKDEHVLREAAVPRQWKMQ